MKNPQYQQLAKDQEDVLRYFLKHQADQVFSELRAISSTTPYTYAHILGLFKQFWEFDRSRELGLAVEDLLKYTRESAKLPDTTLILRAWQQTSFPPQET